MEWNGMDRKLKVGMHHISGFAYIGRIGKN